MFGLLTSMGGTKTDIALSVIAEAFIVGLIALPFGFLLSIAVSYYGISTINNINQLNRDFSQLIFSIDWSYIGISCLFIAIVLFFGISRNATMATNTSPIESILKLNNIKMKKYYYKKK